MNMDTKKIAASFAILMIALGIAGFAYAHWEKIIFVDGTVTTGKFHVTPSFHVDYAEAEGKIVADIGYEVYPEDNYIEIWLNNVYPCLRVDGYIDLINDGTIPVHLVGCDMAATEGVYAVYNEKTEYWEIYQTVPDAPSLLIATGNYWYDFPQGTGTDPYQIDPRGTAYIHFWIHFEEGLPQNAQYSFGITLTFCNWNEWLL